MKATEARKKAKVVQLKKEAKRAKEQAAEALSQEKWAKGAPARARKVFKEEVTLAIDQAIEEGHDSVGWSGSCSDCADVTGIAMEKLLKRKGYKVVPYREWIGSSMDEGVQMGEYWSTHLTISW